ncbi:MAG: hypothetical protein EAZ08_07985 [Cytophagales bacterium]|nr:MAG: hypothetical protein EAZ08_07985 [Cytophagales bacterium]
MRKTINYTLPLHPQKGKHSFMPILENKKAKNSEICHFLLFCPHLCEKNDNNGEELSFLKVSLLFAR